MISRSLLNQKVEDGAPLLQEFVRHPKRIHALQKRSEILSFCELDANKSGATLTVILLGVLKERDVIRRSQSLIEKTPQSAGPLREIDDEVMLEALVDETALDDFRIAANVVVTPRNNAHNSFSLEQRLSELIKHCNGECARRLCDDAVALVERDHFLTDFPLKHS